MSDFICSLFGGRTSLHTGLIARKFCGFLCFWLAYFIQCLTSFSSLPLWMDLDAISSNVDEVLSINPYANAFIFGGFTLHRKDWLTVLVELINLVDSCYNFSIGNGITHMVNFPTLISGSHSHSSALLETCPFLGLLDLCLSFFRVCVLQRLSLH